MLDPDPAQLAGLTGCAAVFEPGDPARTGTLAFWSPDGVALPWRTGSLDVVVLRAGEPVSVPVPAARVPIRAALPVLCRRPPDGEAPVSEFWSAAARFALRVVAQGRVLPGVSPDDHDAWRVGPLEPSDVEHVRALAAAMPAHARATPLPDRAPPELPDAELLVRRFLDAVADAFVRTPAARLVAGSGPYADLEPQHVPDLRPWADEVAAGVDAGVRVSLRLELPDSAVPDRPGTFLLVPQAHSLADPTLVADAATLWDGGTAGFGPRATIDVMLAVRRAARIWPPLERLLVSAVPDALTLGDDEVWDLLADAAPRLVAAGVEVHWPKELARELTAKAVVGTDRPPSDLRAFLGGDELLSFDWRLALGDSPLSDAEMEALAESHRPVVRLRDQWVLVDPDLVRKARERELKPLTPVDALGAALTGVVEVGGERVEVASTDWLAALRERIADPDGGREAVEQPRQLVATLRDYQLRGLRWLARMTSLGLGGCLADDMGLGKTITLIALHLHRHAENAATGPTLVVCPASLLGNWQREIERFAPGVPVHRFHGSTRTLDGVADGFVLTTYGTMRRDTDRLGEVRWGLLVADEAQHVKNPLSGTAKALRVIGSEARVALTGTPVENNLSELWAILDWTTPGLLGSLTAFRTMWATPIEVDKDEERAARLAALVRPFVLRRRKSDPGIAPELPPKTETDQAVSLTREQAGLYEALVREVLAELRKADGMRRRGLVMKLLTGLKQICNHPAQYLREARPRLAGRSGKLELLDELVDTVTAEDGAVLVFTQYVAMARLLERHLADRGIPTQLLHGGTPVRRREEMVRRFQDGDVPVFLLSLKAAGTGLNLTRADHVVHYDRWWNPAVEEQATDRAYRIGQTRPVQVHRMMTEGTVEDRIARMLETKRELADAVLGSGEAALTELTDDELADLVMLRGGGS